MTISILQRLAFKLASASLLVALVLGLIVTFIQVYLDFESENRAADQVIKETLLVSHSSAARAVYTLDPDLAVEVARGLLTYPFVLSVEIEDEEGGIMAKENKEREPSRTAKLTRYLKGDKEVYQSRLLHEGGRHEGKMTVVVDNDKILAPLYKRAFYLFISGLTRNFILGIALALLYHIFLSRPLFQVATNISQIDYRSPKGKRISTLKRHTDDEVGFIINSANDLISHLEEHQQDLQERENQLRVILDSSPNQVFALDETGQFVFVNNAAAKFYGTTSEDLQKSNYFEKHRVINPQQAAELTEVISNISKDKSQNVEQCLTNPDGKDYVLQMSLMHFSLYDQSCILVIATDISARVAAEERVERLAYFDSLTSLPNRNQLHEKLAADIEYTINHKTHGAVLFIDIDDFKRINDTLGHSVGDELLLQLSNKMKTQLRSQETLARLGGDEFILSVPKISNDEDTATNHASHLAERLLNTINAPIELGGHFFSIGASIGIAIYPGIAADIEKLLRYADTAMYQAKSAGRNCYRVFEAPMEEEARSRVRMESELRQGIANQEFTFHLQPLIDANTLKLRGAEALVRWHHPENGMVMPGKFIPFLEQSPMVSQVGAQVFDQVCGFLRKCNTKHLLPEGFRIAVNVSATEFFQPNFVEHIRSTLVRHNLSGDYIELEITESVALEGFDNVIDKMLDLKRNGIVFALDDFGTGYSSLNYLKKLPVNKIKIDKTFIDDVPTSTQDSALVRSVIQIANDLNLNVVVEGVEEKIQADYFATMKGVVIQGYWFDKPMPHADFFDKYLKAPSNSDEIKTES